MGPERAQFLFYLLSSFSGAQTLRRTPSPLPLALSPLWCPLNCQQSPKPGKVPGAPPEGASFLLSFPSSLSVSRQLGELQAYAQVGSCPRVLSKPKERATILAGCKTGQAEIPWEGRTWSSRANKSSRMGRWRWWLCLDRHGHRKLPCPESHLWPIKLGIVYKDWQQFCPDSGKAVFHITSCLASREPVWRSS